MRCFFAILACLCFFGCSGKLISFDKSQPYAQNSKIHSGKALLYKGKKYVIAINAGHGTKGAFCEASQESAFLSGELNEKNNALC